MSCLTDSGMRLSSYEDLLVGGPHVEPHGRSDRTLQMGVHAKKKP